MPENKHLLNNNFFYSPYTWHFYVTKKLKIGRDQQNQQKIKMIISIASNILLVVFPGLKWIRDDFYRRHTEICHAVLFFIAFLEYANDLLILSSWCLGLFKQFQKRATASQGTLIDVEECWDSPREVASQHGAVCSSQVHGGWC